MERHRTASDAAGLSTIIIGLALLVTSAFPPPVLASAPPNDDRADARGLSVPATGITGTMIGATTEPDEPQASAVSIAHTVWYRFRAPASTGLLVTLTRGSPRPVYARISVWREAPDGLAEVVSDAEGYQAVDVWFKATAGTRYSLQVGHVSYGTAGGFGLSIVVNNDVPRATAPVVGITPMRALWSGSVSLQIKWAEQLKTSKTVTRILERSLDGGAWENHGVTGYKTTSWGCPIGHACRFRVHIMDELGRWSPWAVSAPVTPVLVEQDDASVGWSGRWTSQLAQSVSGGSTRYSKTAGAKATFTATGTAVGFVSYRGPNRGRADVYVDGAWTARIDLVSTDYQGMVVAWSARWATSRPRTISIVVRGTAGRPRVDVDGFVVLR